MLRKLKVSEFPQGKIYVPGIRLAGKYLQQFNFNKNDNVLIEIETDKIVIKKDTAKERLLRMIEENPMLLTLIEKLDLKPVVK
jgi:hypothetical protein